MALYIPKKTIYAALQFSTHVENLGEVDRKWANGLTAAFATCAPDAMVKVHLHELPIDTSTIPPLAPTRIRKVASMAGGLLRYAGDLGASKEEKENRSAYRRDKEAEARRGQVELFKKRRL